MALSFIGRNREHCVATERAVVAWIGSESTSAPDCTPPRTTGRGEIEAFGPRTALQNLSQFNRSCSPKITRNTETDALQLFPTESGFIAILQTYNSGKNNVASRI